MNRFILYILCFFYKDSDMGDHAVARALPHQWTLYLIYISIRIFFSASINSYPLSSTRNSTEDFIYYSYTIQTLILQEFNITNILLSLYSVKIIDAILKNCETPGHYEYTGFWTCRVHYYITSDKKFHSVCLV